MFKSIKRKKLAMEFTQMAVNHIKDCGVRPSSKKDRDVKPTKLMNLIGRLCQITPKNDLDSTRSEQIHSTRKRKKMQAPFTLNDLV